MLNWVKMDLVTVLTTGKPSLFKGWKEGSYVTATIR